MKPMAAFQVTGSTRLFVLFKFAFLIHLLFLLEAFPETVGVTSLSVSFTQQSSLLLQLTNSRSLFLPA